MKNTTHTLCRHLVALCVAHGVRRVILSPGSRNAPLLVAFARETRIEHRVVVDERVAAFVALGMAARGNEPVAVVCTSGTALLNYAPAVAEAYYRHLPLIVISADRPDEWIDQDDSQTIGQRGILNHIVKRSYHLPTSDDDTAVWYTRRMVNEALLFAQEPSRGPVHINVPLREPLCEIAEVEPVASVGIEAIYPRCRSARYDVRQLSQTLSQARKVLILVSMMQPSPMLQGALRRMAQLPQVVVLTESVANLHDVDFIPTIDRVLTTVDNSEKELFAPDLLITMGGAPISRMVKEFLRKYPPKTHWRVGQETHIIDTMQSLTHKIVADEALFMDSLAAECNAIQSDYATLWHDREVVATALHNRFVEASPWCDLRAFSILLPTLPQGVVLHLSNGTSVRYAQLFDTPQVDAVYCNRGVSGIDGSTSVALGASLTDDKLHLLITGDMSFVYDAGALATALATPRLKIVVMDNGGGGIFRFIKGPSDLPELEECFEVKRRQPIEGYAALHGFRYFGAKSETQLQSVLPQFYAENEKPAILSVETPGDVNASVLRGYMRRARL